jgi:hypothetical protein
MKKTLLVLSFIIGAIALKSQAPQLLNYQGVARNSSGSIITSSGIGLKFEILQGSTVVYSEEQSASTSAAGIFTASIGSGTNTSGSFSSINWANGPYDIRVSFDATGGTSFTSVGTSRLLSVPYSLYAEKAGSVNLNAGTGISISSGSIINTAPDQSVSISGTGVTGSYPNYTITAPPSSVYTASTGISVTGSVITNTAPDQTITLTPAGISSITGTYPSYTIDVAPPSLSYNAGTQELTLTQGTVVSTATITTSSGSVSITGPNVTGSYPNYTITAVPVTSITSGNSNITITGSAPNYTIASSPSLAVTGNSLSITDGNTVTLPTGTTYTNGAGISLTSGTIITNTAPDQIVTIGNGINTNVTGTYPSFVVNSTPSLSISGNTLSITGGTSVVLPTPAPLTASTGISINSGTITNTAPNIPITLVGAGSTTVGGTYPNFIVGSPLPASPVISGQGAATVTTAGNNYTVNVPLPTYNSNTGVFTTGPNSIPVVPALSISGNVLSSGPVTNSVTVPSYTAGAGLVLTGVSPNFTLGTTSTGSNTSWSTLGNTATIDGTNFIGTTDNIALNFRVNNQKSGRIDPVATKGTTSFGYTAMNALTTGVQNSAFGYEAMKNNTTGSYNTGLGVSSLFSSVSGANNTAVGYYSMYFNTGGHNNTAVGGQALMSNTTGSNNVAVGYEALYTNDPGVNNTAMGYFSLANNFNGNENTAIGGEAMANNNAGSLNTAVGRRALRNNYNGTSNSAFGHQALHSNTNAGNNVAVGNLALYSQSFGASPWVSDNVAVGYQALYSNNPTSTSNGYQNTAIGGGAMLNNTTGYENTALGHQSLFSNNVGTWNTAVGKGALYNNTSGNHNFGGGNYNTTGSDNVAIGYTAMRYNKIGGGNTILGYEAGFGISGNSYNNNTLIGKSAGYSLSTGSGNVFIGYNAGYFETGSNKLFIANNNAAVPLIYGDFVTGNVGIGTTNPTGPLHIQTSGVDYVTIESTLPGTNPFGLEIKSASQSYYFLHSPGAGPANALMLYDGTAGASRITVMPSGNIGIGTGISTPANKLHVNGGVSITDGTQGAGEVFTSDASGNGQWKPNAIAFYSGGNPTAGSTQNLAVNQTAIALFTSGSSIFALNAGGGYNVTNGRFTAPVAGVYTFNATMVCAGATSGFYTMKLKHNTGNTVCEQDGSSNLSATIHLNAGEQIWVEVYAGSSGSMSIYNDKSSFSGHLVYAD